MRSSKIDECFDDREEQIFLYELVEQAIAEGEQALQGHREDLTEEAEPTEWAANLKDIDRQKRRLRFLRMLGACLGGDDDGH